jgi:hypothetical protein
VPEKIVWNGETIQKMARKIFRGGGAVFKIKEKNCHDGETVFKLAGEFSDLKQKPASGSGFGTPDSELRAIFFYLGAPSLELGGSFLELKGQKSELGGSF